MVTDIQARNLGEGSYGKENESLWKTVWKLKVPKNVNMFIWRTCKNILPTKENLYLQKVVKDTACQLCERESESVRHILWSCPSTQDVWGSGVRKFQKGSST